MVAVDKVSVDIYSGEFVAFVGRSGSGKTTLLNLLAGLDRPDEGVVLFEGRELGSFSEREHVELRRNKVSFVFQSFALLPLLSAYENIELPLRISSVSRRERRRRTEEALELVGLSARARHRPYELSGGEQQRVGIARALVTSPSLIIADEPTGELDSATALAIASILQEIVQRQGVTLIVATHDLSLASTAARIIEMVDGALVNAASKTPPPLEESLRSKSR
ncbi:MAG: ABC transporter ATP-binding protein [Dehalococcoidia bacterium]